MGNICAGTKEEDKKRSAFSSFSNAELVDSGVHDQKGVRVVPSSSTKDTSSLQNNAASIPKNASSSTEAQVQQDDKHAKQQQEEQLEAIRRLEKEQARLELIVQSANQRMVSVRSTRGSNAYYDQGFAAALSQHLEQTTTFPDLAQQQPLSLPAAHPAVSVYERLSASPPPLPQGGTEAADTYHQRYEAFMDRVAESLLEDVAPQTERLFENVDPMVESLI